METDKSASKREEMKMIPNIGVTLIAGEKKSKGRSDLKVQVRK